MASPLKNWTSSTKVNVQTTDTDRCPAFLERPSNTPMQPHSWDSGTVEQCSSLQYIMTIEEWTAVTLKQVINWSIDTKRQTAILEWIEVFYMMFRASQLHLSHFLKMKAFGSWLKNSVNHFSSVALPSIDIQRLWQHQFLLFLSSFKDVGALGTSLDGRCSVCRRCQRCSHLDWKYWNSNKECSVVIHAQYGHDSQLISKTGI